MRILMIVVSFFLFFSFSGCDWKVEPQVVTCEIVETETEIVATCSDGTTETFEIEENLSCAVNSDCPNMERTICQSPDGDATVIHPVCSPTGLCGYSTYTTISEQCVVEEEVIPEPWTVTVEVCDPQDRDVLVYFQYVNTFDVLAFTKSDQFIAQCNTITFTEREACTYTRLEIAVENVLQPEDSPVEWCGDVEGYPISSSKSNLEVLVDGVSMPLQFEQDNQYSCYGAGIGEGNLYLTDEDLGCPERQPSKV